VKKRIGDRRGRGRFEIVGSLSGTLETVRHLGVRNVGAGGALVDSSVPLTPGSRVSGRLAFKGHGRDVQARVRHITTLPDRTRGMRYLVGLEWEPATQVDDLLRAEPLRALPVGARHGPERRAGQRVSGDGEVELGQPTWSTVEVIDISTIGVLFASPVPGEIGETGKLRMRLGDRSFAAQIEVRRSDARKTAQAAYRVGAAFLSLDEGSRMHLEDFIGDARR
jgi:hypothetical protein